MIAYSAKEIPWRNGLGTTRQLLIDPVDADLDSFSLRISSAKITSRRSDFSAFPNHRRILVVLSGGPIRLLHDNNGEWVELKAMQTVHSFSGSSSTLCEVLAAEEPFPPVVDFNVMYAKDGAAWQCVLGPAKAEKGSFVFVAQGEFAGLKTGEMGRFDGDEDAQVPEGCCIVFKSK